MLHRRLYVGWDGMGRKSLGGNLGANEYFQYQQHQQQHSHQALVGCIFQINSDPSTNMQHQGFSMPSTITSTYKGDGCTPVIGGIQPAVWWWQNILWWVCGTKLGHIGDTSGIWGYWCWGLDASHWQLFWLMKNLWGVWASKWGHKEKTLEFGGICLQEDWLMKIYMVNLSNIMMTLTMRKYTVTMMWDTEGYFGWCLLLWDLDEGNITYSVHQKKCKLAISI